MEAEAASPEVVAVVPPLFLIIKVYAFDLGVARDNDLSWLRSLLCLDTGTLHRHPSSWQNSEILLCYGRVTQTYNIVTYTYIALVGTLAYVLVPPLTPTPLQYRDASVAYNIRPILSVV